MDKTFYEELSVRQVTHESFFAIEDMFGQRILYWFD